MILMKYHALFVIFEKAARFESADCMLQIRGGALRVNAYFCFLFKRDTKYCNGVRQL